MGVFLILASDDTLKKMCILFFFSKTNNGWAFLGIGASFRIDQEIQWLPYTGFYNSDTLFYIVQPLWSAKKSFFNQKVIFKIMGNWASSVCPRIKVVFLLHIGILVNFLLLFDANLRDTHWNTLPHTSVNYMIKKRSTCLDCFIHYIIIKNLISKLCYFNIAILDKCISQYTDYPVFNLGSTLWNIAPRECTVKYIP